MRTCYLFLAKKYIWFFWFLPGLNCLSFYLLADAFTCINSYFGQFINNGLINLSWTNKYIHMFITILMRGYVPSICLHENQLNCFMKKIYIYSHNFFFKDENFDLLCEGQCVLVMTV